MSSNNFDTRKRILEATRQLLEADEKNQTRMSDIAKAAGISRQAVYLHFDNRAELLIATTRYLDEIFGVDEKLEKSRNATSGIERLDGFIDVWGNYIPVIYGMAKALLSMRDDDDAASDAWGDRMGAVRHGCEAAVNALAKDGQLTENYNKDQCVDILWTLLSVRNWEHLTQDCGWTQKSYIEFAKSSARKLLL